MATTNDLIKKHLTPQEAYSAAFDYVFNKLTK
jgi:hypothetical protein